MEQAGPEAQPDGDSYNFVIALCALDRRVAPALKHMQAMYERGLLPSKTTYNELLLACARVHRTQTAVAVLKELKVELGCGIIIVKFESLFMLKFLPRLNEG